MAILGWLVLVVISLIGFTGALVSIAISCSQFGGKSELVLGVILAVATYILSGAVVDHAPFTLLVK